MKNVKPTHNLMRCYRCNVVYKAPAKNPACRCGRQDEKLADYIGGVYAAGGEAERLSVEFIDYVLRNAPSLLRESYQIILNGKQAGFVGTNRERWGLSIPGIGTFDMRKADHMKELEGLHLPAPWYHNLSLILRNRAGGVEVYVTSFEEVVVNFLSSEYSSENGEVPDYAASFVDAVEKL